MGYRLNARTTVMLSVMLAGCADGALGMAGSPIWMASATPEQKQAYVDRTYKQVQPTNN